jgi:hypothetical protein
MRQSPHSALSAPSSIDLAGLADNPQRIKESALTFGVATPLMPRHRVSIAFAHH